MKYEEGYVCNDEMQYYTKKRPENAMAQNGYLIIEKKSLWTKYWYFLSQVKAPAVMCGHLTSPFI